MFECAKGYMRILAWLMSNECAKGYMRVLALFMCLTVSMLGGENFTKHDSFVMSVLIGYENFSMVDIISN